MKKNKYLNIDITPTILTHCYEVHFYSNHWPSLKFIKGRVWGSPPRAPPPLARAVTGLCGLGHSPLALAVWGPFNWPPSYISNCYFFGK